MRAVAEVNKYVSDSEPWKLKGDDQRERLGTILHVLAQCVARPQHVLSPFLPFSANAVDVVLGGSGEVQPMPRAGRGRRPRRRSGLPDPHRRLLRRRPLGAPPGRGRARRSPSRRRCSPSSTPRSSTRSSPGSPTRASVLMLLPAGAAGRRGRRRRRARSTTPRFDIAAARERGRARPRARAARAGGRGARRRRRRRARAGSTVPEGAGPGVVVHLHGGGFVLNDVEVHDNAARGSPTGAASPCSASTTAARPSTGSRPRPTTSTPCVGWLDAHADAEGLAGPAYAHGDSAGANLALVAALRHPGRFARRRADLPVPRPAQARGVVRPGGRGLRPGGRRPGTGSSTPPRRTT